LRATYVVNAYKKGSVQPYEMAYMRTVHQQSRASVAAM
jgi:hypothetical protein